MRNLVLLLLLASCDKVVTLHDLGHDQSIPDLGDLSAQSSETHNQPVGILPLGYWELGCGWDACEEPYSPNYLLDPIKKP